MGRGRRIRNLDDAGFKKPRYRALLAALELPPPIAAAVGRRWENITTRPGALTAR